VKLVALSRQLYRDCPFAIHRAGCRDIAQREVPYHGSVQVGRAATVQAAIDLILDEEIVAMGWTADDIRIFPCTGVAS